MKNWKQVPLPHKMKDLQRDRRSLPIPFVVMIDKAKKPHFIINDTNKQLECIDKKLCAICGKRLRGNIWLIGGELSAFHPNGAYVDTPVHHQCGEFALQVCPYLSEPNYNTNKPNIGDLTDFPKEVVGLYDPTTIMETPFFVFVRISGYDVRLRNVEQHYVIPHRPYLEVQYWKGGKQLTTEEIEPLRRLKTHSLI